MQATLEAQPVRSQAPQTFGRRAPYRPAEQRFFLLLRVYGTLAFNIVVLWGLLAGLLYGFAVFYQLPAKAAILLVTPCAIMAVNGVLRTLTSFLFNPKGQGTRVVPCSQHVARHFAYYLRLLTRLTAICVPLAVAFSLAGYPRGFVQAAWLGYQIVAFLLVVLLFYRRALMRELVPVAVDSAVWNLLYRALQVAYPLVALYILTLIILFGVGYQNLAAFLGTSTAFTLIILAGGFLLWKYLQLQIAKWEASLQSRLAQAGDLRPDEVDNERKQYTALLGSLRLLIRYSLVIILTPLVLYAWGLGWDAQWAVASHKFDADEKVSLALVVLAVMLVLLTLFAGRLLRQLLRQRLLSRAELDRGTQSALSSASFFIIVGIGIYFALDFVGIELTAFEWFFGLLGIGLGFGLQNIVANFVSGIVLLVEKPIKTDDIVEVGATWGVVDRIGVRSTTIVNKDNVSFIIPNSHFINEDVINWSHRDVRSRLRVKIGVAYGSDVQKVRRALLEVAERHGLVLKRPTPEVRFVAFGNSSLDFELHVFVNEVDRKDRIISDLNFAIDAAFRKVGVEIPFPQRDLHLRSAVPLTLAPPPPPSEEATEESSDG